MNMLPKAIFASILVLFGAVASGSAMAQHYRHGGNVRFGFYIGAPFYGPGYYPAPYYTYPPYAYPGPAYAYPGPAYGYPPAAAFSSPPPVYVEQGAPAASPAPAQPQGDWYYCADSKAYYPYARECPGGWQRVPAQPPSR